MKDKNNIWMSFTDLFMVLSVLFLMVGLVYMMKVKKISNEYANIKANIHNELKQEFADELEEWNAVLMKEDLTIRFLEPDVVFKKGSSDLKDGFKTVLDEFLPKYTAILMKSEFRNEIAEVKIKGHTSSEWAKGADFKTSYIKNMELSQDRSREVLSHWIDLTLVDELDLESCSLIKGKTDTTDWIINNVTANGLSFSKKIVDSFGEEDKEASRRVEFQIVTKTEERLSRLTK